MYFNMDGITFTRLQRSGTSAIGDPIAPDVLFDGRFLGGFCMFRTLAVDAGGNTASKSYNLAYGRTFANPPLVFGMLRTAQAYVDNFGQRWFEANEFVTPCLGTYNVANQGRARNFEFSYLAYADQLLITIGGFVGTCSFLIVELN